MGLLQSDEESCRSEILHVRVYGLDLSKGILRVENFLASLKKNRVRTNGGRTLVVYSTWLVLGSCLLVLELCTKLPLYLLLINNNNNNNYEYGYEY